LRQYWELFKDTRWPGHRVAAPVKGVDSILEYDLASDFDMDDPDALTTRIKTARWPSSIASTSSSRRPSLLNNGNGQHRQARDRRSAAEDDTGGIAERGGSAILCACHPCAAALREQS
jgi:hypothetical protein